MVPETTQTPVEQPAPTLLGFFLLSLRIGFLSFGGGITLLLHREFVERRPWIGERDFAALMVAAQVLPGANVTNLLVAIGVRLFGLAAAPLAIIGLLAGPFMAAIGILELFKHAGRLPHIDEAIMGVTAAASGLLLLVAWKTGRASVTGWHGYALVAATVLIVGILQWPLLPAIAGLLPVSLVVAWWTMRPK